MSNPIESTNVNKVSVTEATLYAGISKLILGILIFSILKFTGCPFYMVKWGILAWSITVTAKMCWAILFHKKILALFRNITFSWFSICFCSLYTGLLTAVTECGFLLWIVKQKPALVQYNFKGWLTFGIAFAAWESMILGLSNTIQFFHTRRAENPEGRIEGNRGYRSLILALTERIWTLPIHTVSCLGILYTARFGNSYIFWSVFMLKTAVDGLAGWYHERILIEPSAKYRLTVLFEILLFIFALISSVFIFWAASKF
ncbi:MAG: hypothetical protein CVV64_15105 [Candidatus Wallbacteria bacterium HGW-Wallbacteria-1]|jgi:hypothetical protein|uniref:Uncharacterized protein n=1 Tax=Candidatus Wallbacteria bacterium HGW-Wallbacteria-1 TaxID=2013854 RepID=A0A2N1PLM0_9BACT|nr:MAG: hypothetical protein CVV64_15105 [Candidatus Wallbacteria bacterium HGW-Wallbacteria-1]